MKRSPLKRRSPKYATTDAGGWRVASDDLFLAQFRGQPCAVCGTTIDDHGRSMGHHLLSKELHRVFRYTDENIIVLCNKHHLGGEMSPHSHDVAGQCAFYDWLAKTHPKKMEYILRNRGVKFAKDWTYFDIYNELLGGEWSTESGLIRDRKPKNHRLNVILKIAESGGRLLPTEQSVYDKWLGYHS